MSVAVKCPVAKIAQCYVRDGFEQLAPLGAFQNRCLPVFTTCLYYGDGNRGGRTALSLTCFARFAGWQALSTGHGVRISPTHGHTPAVVNADRRWRFSRCASAAGA